jgi:hypothetical protein
MIMQRHRVPIRYATKAAAYVPQADSPLTSSQHGVVVSTTIPLQRLRSLWPIVQIRHNGRSRDPWAYAAFARSPFEGPIRVSNRDQHVQPGKKDGALDIVRWNGAVQARPVAIRPQHVLADMKSKIVRWPPP